MTDFKERLKLELRSEVPFTKEVEERIMQNEPRKKKKIAFIFGMLMLKMTKKEIGEKEILILEQV